MRLYSKTIQKILLTSIILLMAGFAVLSGPFETKAQITHMLNFAGKVTNTDGSEVTDGNYDFTFSLYDASSSGTELWTETLDATTRFSATIASYNSGTYTYTYSGASATSTLRIGQHLTNADTGESVLITAFDTSANTITVVTGSPTWTAGQSINTVPYVEGGVIDENLGSVTDLSSVNFNQPVYLEITFNAETMQPRKMITAVAQAFNADKLDGYDASEFANLADDSIVTGSWTFNNNLAVVASSTETALTITQNGSGDIVNFFDSGGAEIFTVTGAGNVGIGTSTPENKLDILGDLGVRNQNDFRLYELSTNGNEYVGFRASSTLSSNLVWTLPTTAGSSGDALMVNSNGDLEWGTVGSGSGTVNNGTAGYLPYYAADGSTLTATSSLFIASSGNVGIGTSTPAYKLDVYGNARIDGNITANNLNITNWDIAYGWGDHSTAGYNTQVFASSTYLTMSDYYSSTTPEHIVGLSNLATVGTITSGTWQGDVIDTAYGGTGLDSSAWNGMVSVSAGTWSTITGTANNLAYWSDANTVSATSSIYLANNSNVGIGTSTPQNKLDIVGNLGIANQNSLRLYELGNNGMNYVGFRASSTLSSNLVWTLPTTAGSSGDALMVNSNGDLEWGVASQGTVNSGTAGYLPYYASAGDTLTATSSLFIATSSKIGIGTTTPSQQLTLTGNLELQDTTNASQYGVIYKGDSTFIHNFNYGYNGSVTTDGYNTFVGEGSGNLTMGSTAILATQASYNTGLGVNTLSSLTTGYYNVALGGGSLYSNTTGGYNTAVGYRAGRYAGTGTDANSASTYSIYLGQDTRASASGSTNEVVIGSGAVGLGSNSVVLGNNSITKTVLKGDVGIGTTTPEVPLHVVSGGGYSGTRPTWLNADVMVLENADAYSTALNLLSSYDTSSYIAFSTSGTNGAGYISYVPNAHTLRFSASGTIPLVVTGDGTVGIGTSTSPEATLHVRKGTIGATTRPTWLSEDVMIIENDVNENTALQILSASDKHSSIYFSDNYDRDVGGIIYNHSDDSMTFRAGSSSSMMIANNGYVGIGTTNPTVPLSLQGTAGEAIFKIASSTGDSIFYIDAQGEIGMGTETPDATLMIAATSTAQLKLAYTGSAHQASFTVGSEGTFTIESNEPGNVYIDPTSKLGVGTSSPQSTLSVYGDVFIEGTNRYVNFGGVTGLAGYGIRDNAGTLEIKNSGTAWTPVTLVQSGQVGWVPRYYENSPNLQATSSIFISNAGYVGIGDQSPTSQLSLGGDVDMNNHNISEIGFLDIGTTYGYGLRFNSLGASSITWGNDSTHQFGGVDVSGIKINTGALDSGTGVTFGPYGDNPTASINSNGTLTLNGFAFIGGARLTLSEVSNRASSSILVQTSQGIPFLEFSTSTGETYMYVDRDGSLSLNAGKTANVRFNVGAGTPSIVSSDVADSYFAGQVEINDTLHITNQNALRLYEVSGNGTNYIGISATSSVANSVTYTLPEPGSAGQALLLGENNNLYWGVSGAGTINSGTANQITYYASTGDAVNGTSTITILPSGYVGIGSTTPHYNLAVTGSFYADDIYTSTSTFYMNNIPILSFNNDQNVLKFYEASANGSNFMQLSATSTLSTDISYTLPEPGSAGQALLLGENNNLYWGYTSLGAGTAGQVPIYASDGTSIEATSTLFVSPNGNFGVGTTTPESKLFVQGDLMITGDYLSYSSSTLGSPATRIKMGYFDEIDVLNGVSAPASANGTDSSTFTLNTDNATADTEDSTLAFERGSITPNATLTWDSTSDRFSMNQDLYLQSNNLTTLGSVGIGTTSVVARLTIEGAAGQPILQVASSTGADILYINAQGNIGIATTTMTDKLAVLGDIGIGDQGAVKLYEVASNGMNSISLKATSSIASDITYTLPASGTVGQALLLGTDNHLYWGTTGSGGVGAGTIGQFPYYSLAGSSVTATSTIFLDTNGYFGIGTSSPDYKLDVYGNARIDGNITADNLNITNWDLAYGWGDHSSAGYLDESSYYASSSPEHITSLPSSSYVANAWDALSDMVLVQGNIYVGSGSGSPSATTTIFISSSQYVGIGTTTPGNKLDVYGDIGIRNQNGLRLYELATNGVNYIEFTATSTLASNITYTWPGTGSAGQILKLGADNNLYWDDAASGSGSINSGTTGQFPYYATGGTTLTATSTLFMDTVGDIGIGTTSPDYLFHVYGNRTDYLARMYNTNTSASSSGLSIRSDGTGTLFNLNSNGTDIVTITSAQTLFNNPVSFGSAGDVSIAYDLYFTNDTASYINFNGPGYIRTDSAWQNLDLTLSAANSGQVIVDDQLVVTGGASTSIPLLIDSDSTATTTEMFQITSNVNSTGSVVFEVDSAGNVTRDGTDTTPAADYAEYYFTHDTDLKSGEAVCVDITHKNAVKRCERASDSNVMGIVSTKPAIIGNAKSDYINNSSYVIVGMLGQVPAKVSTENGVIRPGDSLTSASAPGYVMKAGDGDPTVGVALEGFGKKTTVIASSSDSVDNIDMLDMMNLPTDTASSTTDTASSSPETATSTPEVPKTEELSEPETTVVLETGEINVLISRRNKSLTVETVEAQVTDRIAEMKIEDEVQILIANAVGALDLDNEIQPIVNEQIALFDGKLTTKFDSFSNQLTTIAASTDDLLARMNVVESGIISLAQEQISFQNQISEVDEQLIRLGDSGQLNLNSILVDSASGLAITNNEYRDDSEPAVSIVEIVTATSTQKTAFVVNQLGDGDVVDFQADGVSIVNIADDGKVSVVGEMSIDGRLMVCSGTGCGNTLDNAVDETMGDMGVEGKVVAGAFESVCEEGFVWVPGSSKYGTMPGFCVMESEARVGKDNIPTTALEVEGHDSSIWVNVSQGEAQLACQTMGDNYHLITENEWLTIAENIIRVGENDIDADKIGLQLATSSPETSVEFTLSNGNKVYDLVGSVSEWTDMVVTRAGLIQPTSEDWQEYHDIVDFRGFNIAPPYYYDSSNGIGRIKVEDNDNTLRGFVRGETSLYDLDLSNPPTFVAPEIGFRCSK